MRTRVNLIIEEALLVKIDQLAGDKNKRAATIETALREYIAREEAKAPIEAEVVEAVGKKNGAKTK